MKPNCLFIQEVNTEDAVFNDQVDKEIMDHGKQTNSVYFLSTAVREKSKVRSLSAFCLILLGAGITLFTPLQFSEMKYFHTFLVYKNWIRC